MCCCGCMNVKSDAVGLLLDRSLLYSLCAGRAPSLCPLCLVENVPVVFVSAGPAVPPVPPPGAAAAPAGPAAGGGPAPAAHTGGQTQPGPGPLEREPAGRAVAHLGVNIALE